MKNKTNVAPANEVPAIIGSIFKIVFVIIGTIVGAGFASRSRNIFIF